MKPGASPANGTVSGDAAEGGGHIGLGIREVVEGRGAAGGYGRGDGAESGDVRGDDAISGGDGEEDGGSGGEDIEGRGGSASGGGHDDGGGGTGRRVEGQLRIDLSRGDEVERDGGAVDFEADAGERGGQRDGTEGLGRGRQVGAEDGEDAAGSGRGGEARAVHDAARRDGRKGDLADEEVLPIDDVEVVVGIEGDGAGCIEGVRRATVVMLPEAASMRRMRWLPVSAM